MNGGLRRVDDDLINFALIGIGTVLALAATLRGAGSIVAQLAGAPQPRSDVSAGLRVLARPSDPAAALVAPGMSTAAYWAVVAAILTTIAATAYASWRVVLQVRHAAAHDPHRIVGIATRPDIAPAASKRALVRRGRTLRP
jgi:hypothetical protein